MESASIFSMVIIIWDSIGNGILFVEAYDSIACLMDTLTKVINVKGLVIGIKYFSDNRLSIYPNPFNNSTIIEFVNKERFIYKLCVFDLLGNKVRHINNISVNKLVFEKGDLNPGTYFIELSSGELTMRGTVIIK